MAQLDYLLPVYSKYVWINKFLSLRNHNIYHILEILEQKQLETIKKVFTYFPFVGKQENPWDGIMSRWIWWLATTPWPITST